ncbi:uncharacterized protein LOC121425191 [Lytechinus variegatus]|uniref:uncharacterized protein LOC121425191 n=1 Tax=Lytechinus variegatus TaxID=7654 RepID=UPI001BB13EC5|nr:uncharacterized protein LOC121425191 [Lytechinus variegatus]
MDGKSETVKLRLAVCEAGHRGRVQGLLHMLSRTYPELEVEYYELPYNRNEIDDFKLASDTNLVLLCHSIGNRRIVITDVQGALYDEFLNYTAETVGRDRVCIIVHDFTSIEDLSKPDRYKLKMEQLRNQQGKAFKNSYLVMMCGELCGPGVQLLQRNLNDLDVFIRNAFLEVEVATSNLSFFIFRHNGRRALFYQLFATLSYLGKLLTKARDKGPSKPDPVRVIKRAPARTMARAAAQQNVKMVTLKSGL